MKKITPQLSATIKAMDKAYSSGSPKFFDYFATDATIFRTDSAEPFASVAEFRRYFEPLLTKGKRTLRVLSRSVQMMDHKAIISQSLQITQEDVTFNIRQSVVWSREDSTWRVIHLHTAQFGVPHLPTTQTLSKIKVLNERIATVAAVVGVAQ